MPFYCLLPTARAHPGIWWIQKFLYTTPWSVKHCWHYHSVSLPCLVTGASLCLGSTACRLDCQTISTTRFEQSFYVLAFISKISNIIVNSKSGALFKFDELCICVQDIYFISSLCYTIRKPGYDERPL